MRPAGPDLCAAVPVPVVVPGFLPGATRCDPEGFPVVLLALEDGGVRFDE